MNPSLPDHFPALYHSHHIRHLEDLPYWRGLAQAQGGPILELGCGTGRVLVHLAQAGYPTVGIDNSYGMLAFLRDNLPQGLEPLPRLLLSDMSAFCLAVRFPLILLPCNMMSTLSESVRKKTLATIAHHLGQGGCFSFGIPNPSVLLRLPERGESEVEEIFGHPQDGEPVQVSSAWERTRDKFILSWHYDHLLPNGKVERYTAQVSQWIIAYQTYMEEILSAGLKVVNLFGDFDHSPYTERSPSLILQAILP